MDVSELRKRILRGIDDARRETSVRRSVVDEARKDYERFLVQVAVPMFRQAALVLNAAVQPHEVHTPAETVRLVSEQSPHTYLEIELDTARAQPAVIGRVSLARGRQGHIVEERPIGDGKAISTLTEEDLSAFLVGEIPKLVVKF